MQGKLPNLLIIGAMKSGTTSLHNYLSKHPDIYMSKPKEIHYYADEDYHTKSIDWYKNFFKTNKKIAGTTPQSYTKCHNKYYRNIPERIVKNSPDIKMIYIVRDPIERYKSHILESYHCDSPKDVKYSIESENYLKTSMYYMQISEYLKFFNLIQIHILSLEDLTENHLVEINKIFAFLNISKLSDNSVFNFMSNTAEQKTLAFVVKNNFFFKIGNKIAPKLNEKIAYTFTNIFLKNQIKKPNLSSEKINELKRKLKPDIEKFRELTGKSFHQWKI